MACFHSIRARCPNCAPEVLAPMPKNLQAALDEITKLRYRVSELEKKKICKCPDTYWHFASGCADE